MGIHRGPRIITDGCILALDAADRNSYPGSGTTWIDLTTAGNNSTLVNTPTFSSIDSLGSFTFNGSTQYVSTLTASGFQTFTFSIWFKTTSSSSSAIYWQNPTIFGKANSGNGSGDYGISVSGGKIAHWSGLGNADSSWLVGPTVNDNKWYEVTVASDGTTSSLYLNGVLQSGSGLSVTRSFNSEAFWLGGLGGSQGGAGFYLSCSIGKASVYNRGLTAGEILQNFNALRGRFGV